MYKSGKSKAQIHSHSSRMGEGNATFPLEGLQNAINLSKLSFGKSFPSANLKIKVKDLDDSTRDPRKYHIVLYRIILCFSSVIDLNFVV